MRYRLRTLLIVLALVPPALAWSWSEFARHRIRELWREAVERAAEVTTRT